jgi:hypothetical protein
MSLEKSVTLIGYGTVPILKERLSTTISLFHEYFQFSSICGSKSAAGSRSVLFWASRIRTPAPGSHKYGSGFRSFHHQAKLARKTYLFATSLGLFTSV